MSEKARPIEFLNRHTGTVEREQIYGEGPLRFAYENPVGRGFLELLVKRGIFSKWYGWRMSAASSKARVLPFIKKYGLDAAEFAEKPEKFNTFNEFFYRKLELTARPVDPNPNAVVFPADGRHLGFPDVSKVSGIFVKGQRFDLAALLGSETLAKRFENGTLVLSRLCPVDYHRFHFPFAGIPGPTQVLNGPLYSVSPVALRHNVRYLWENKRTITLLETERLGTVICMEIGATNVGSIVQTFQPGIAIEKGAEKGYFAFGGSSTITIFEEGKVTLDPDLVESSAQQQELYVRMGHRLGGIA